MAKREVRPGVWEVDVYDRRQPDGTRPRIVRRVKGTQRTADRLERELLNARDRGEPMGRTPLLSDYFESWLAHRRPDIEPQTHSNYENAGKRYLTSRIGSLRLDQVTPPVVRNLMVKLADDGLSGSTRRYAFRVLGMVMHQAVEDHLISHSPCDAVRPPKEDRKEAGALAPEGLRELLALLEGSPVYLPAVIAYDTGMRRGEFLALRWTDVDLKKRVIRISQAAEHVKGHEPRLKDTKSPRSRRVVALSPPAAAALKAHKAEQLQVRMKHPRLWDDNGLVFPSVVYHGAGEPMGRLWTPNAFSHAWRKALTFANERRLGEFVKDGGQVEDFEPWEFGVYILRHSHATHLLLGGVRLEVVSRALGHSSSHVTSTFYSHVIDGEQAVTAKITGQVLGGA